MVSVGCSELRCVLGVILYTACMDRDLHDATEFELAADLGNFGTSMLVLDWNELQFVGQKVIASVVI